MPVYRSRTTTHGRNMAGARALWRATGMKETDWDKPIIVVANSFTQFVPGHVHLKDLGQLVAAEIDKAGGVAREFSTIAVDDGIAMGHGGMLYSLPSRALIADGRCSGGTSDLSIGHVSPEAAEGGNIGLVQEGDTIEIDIPGRGVHLTVPDEELTRRRAAMEAKGQHAWQPAARQRVVSATLLAYAALTTSAATGAVRDVSQVEGRRK